MSKAIARGPAIPWSQERLNGRTNVPENPVRTICERVSIAASFRTMRFLRRLRREPAPAAPVVPASLGDRLTLRSAPVGCPLVIKELRADSASCLRLRELGFCEAARVSKLTAGGNLICSVCGVRVALALRLGELVVVEPADVSLPA